MSLRWYIEATDQPTVIYIIHTMVSVNKQTICLKTLPKTTPFSPKVYLCQCRTTLQCLSSYGCAITIVYVSGGANSPANNVILTIFYIVNLQCNNSGGTAATSKVCTLAYLTASNKPLPQLRELPHLKL